MELTEAFSNYLLIRIEHQTLRLCVFYCLVFNFHTTFYASFKQPPIKDIYYSPLLFDTLQVSRSARPQRADNVSGLVTDGSCMRCQLCVSQLYQNKKLGAQLQLAVTAWWGIKTKEWVVRLLLGYCLHDGKYVTPALASPIKHHADLTARCLRRIIEERTQALIHY